MGRLGGRRDSERQHQPHASGGRVVVRCPGADGNIIGGGTGYGGAQLPPSARFFFKIDNGMRPIPFYRAASALVSVVPVYQQTP